MLQALGTGFGFCKNSQKKISCLCTFKDSYVKVTVTLSDVYVVLCYVLSQYPPTLSPPRHPFSPLHIRVRPSLPAHPISLRNTCRQYNTHTHKCESPISCKILLPYPPPYIWLKFCSCLHLISVRHYFEKYVLHLQYFSNFVLSAMYCNSGI